MPSFVLRDIAHLVTFDDAGRELSGVDLLVRDGRVAAIGERLSAPGAEAIDASGLLVLPGLVNAHQHLYQVGLRCLPGLERAAIGPWLGGVTDAVLDAWRAGRFDPGVVHALARAGLVESVLTGVTTVADQHYVFPGGTAPYVEAVIDASQEVGLRLNAGRGTLTLTRERGGGAPDEVVQTVAEVLDHSEALIEAHHEPGPFAHVRIDLAPCGVHADELELFARFAELAAEHPDVGLHTHLYEVVDAAFARERHGTTPWRLLVDHGWAQPRTWLAHMVDTPLDEIPEMAAADVGIVHLIGPDLRMGWGLAPVRAYLDHGCRLGFGTTGSASNDGANQLGDLRVAALAHRMGDADPTRWPTARELLRMATRGSADVLHRSECGHLSVGAAADLAAWDLRSVDRVGVHDPVVGLLLTGISDRASLVAVGGELVVRDGRCTTVDEAEVAATARAALAGA